MDGICRITRRRLPTPDFAVSGETGGYPEFKNNVKTVEIRGFWRTVEQSPKNQGFHYNQNAETYLLVGETAGKAMVKLLKGN